jgi:putative DNA primase/helicase
MSEPEVVKFPSAQPSDDEQLRRLRAEAERLANKIEIERNFFLPRSAEAIGVEPATLKAAMNAILKERAKSVAADRRREDRKEQQRAAEERKADQLTKQEALEQERERERLEKEQAREKQRAEKAAANKEKEKQKAFATFARLPVARHSKELERLAEKLGEDAAALHEAFAEFLGMDRDDEAPSETEPWHEPVDIAAILSELSDKITRYVVMTKPYQMTAAVLWTAHCWLYDHRVPIHSPMLAATSAEANSGKTTLVVVAGHATPRFKLNIETTGPTLYRYVDQFKPTMVLDEADDIFKRRSDLKHIINAGWTRGAKIPRQEKINGVWQTVWFDPFTPKAISLLGNNLPPATRTRCIEIRMVPKTPDEKAEEFTEDDDAEFAVLRRKFARFAADNATPLKDANPAMPPGLNNRAAANWKLLLAIAELAGGAWPERAREAAERLTQTRHRPSYGVRLLAAFKEIFGDGRKVITSAEMVAYLCRDPNNIWVEYRRGGPITQRQIADLAEQYEIFPDTVHPSKRSNDSAKGYKAEQFRDAFARYLHLDPDIRTLQPQPKKTAAKKKALKPRKQAKRRK